ncbi:MAG: BON domain-containing protein [Puia sp.]|nr:BON domain-containing protein [Puia sp.]
MRTDLQIQQDVIDQLKWEPVLNAASIGVAVKNGIVTLTGIVDTYFKKITAEDAAKKVAGVKAVAEDIQVGVSPSFRKTDAEIAEAVLNALKWNTLIPDEKIKIAVENGVVTMEGELFWEYQRNAAAIAVGTLAGVKRVNNLITIKSDISVSPSDVRQKIFAAFQRSATIDSGRVSVEVIGKRVILSGKVRSLGEKEDAVYAAWSAPGVTAVENKLSVEEEQLAY